MKSLQEYWNDSGATIPHDKDPSAYALERESQFPRAAVVCDLGGGSGVDSLYFAQHGHTVKLIDISDIALAKARNAAASLNLAASIQTFQVDLGASHVPLPESSCDVVYSRLALHYFKAHVLARLFAEIYRILKPGGHAYLTLKSPGDELEMKYLESTAQVIEPGVFSEGGHIKTRFSIDQLTQIAQSAGLKPTEYTLAAYIEPLSGRKDRIKSGKTEFIVTEARIIKTR